MFLWKLYSHYTDNFHISWARLSSAVLKIHVCWNIHSIKRTQRCFEMFQPLGQNRNKENSRVKQCCTPTCFPTLLHTALVNQSRSLRVVRYQRGQLGPLREGLVSTSIIAQPETLRTVMHHGLCLARHFFSPAPYFKVIREYLWGPRTAGVTSFSFMPVEIGCDWVPWRHVEGRKMGKIGVNALFLKSISKHNTTT